MIEGTALAENVRLFGHGTLVPQEDAPALAAAMRAVLQQGDFSQVEKARRRILAIMGPEVVATQHEKLYREVLGS